MKANTIAIALTAFFGAAAANPIAINADAPTDLNKRLLGITLPGLPGLPQTPQNTQIQLPQVPTPISSLTGLSILGNLSLPALPGVGGGNPLEAVIQAVAGLLASLLNLQNGLSNINLPGSGSSPIPVPSIPNLNTTVPAPTILPGDISPAQILALLNAIEIQLRNLAAVGSGIGPFSGLSITQINQISQIIASAQQQVQAVLAGVTTIGNAGQLPGGLQVGSITNILGTVTSLLTNLPNLLIGLTGVINLLRSLNLGN